MWSCNGLTDGSATVIVSGGNGIYSYQWDLAAGGQITDTAINLGAGTYNVTVLDQYGCNLDTSVIVFQKDSFSYWVNLTGQCELYRVI